LFPQTDFLFPNKDDAQKNIDKDTKNENINRQFGLSPSDVILSAFNSKPKARVPSKIKTDEEKYERDYHSRVDDKVFADITISKNNKTEAENILKKADVELRDEYKAARENGYLIDDHIIISHNIKKKTADGKIEASKKELDRLNKIRNTPYFARIDCGKSMNSLHTVYLGEEDINDFVVSWRNPEYGNAYYQSDMLKERSDMVLALKRFISISHGKFGGYEDEFSLYGDKKTTYRRYFSRFV
jgi:hypothetical protein